MLKGRGVIDAIREGETRHRAGDQRAQQTAAECGRHRNDFLVLHVL
ncbi:MAG: hypothetical protein V4793_15415 [Paraburkholderia tropica]